MIYNVTERVLMIYNATMSKVDQDNQESKKFGFLMSVILLVTSVFIFLKGSSALAYVLAFLFLLIFLISFCFPVVIKPLYIIWIKIGSLIGKVVNPAVLGIIFFCIITPTAIMIRLIGRDELRLKMSHKKTYWIKREDELESTSFNNQF